MPTGSQSLKLVLLTVSNLSLGLNQKGSAYALPFYLLKLK
ncbi:hypothetical protein AO381_1539 [Moraxella catarrhalis]|nr:hypothetical protein AO381_1539 [Moraxella catarrhalis]